MPQTQLYRIHLTNLYEYDAIIWFQNGLERQVRFDIRHFKGTSQKKIKTVFLLPARDGSRWKADNWHKNVPRQDFIRLVILNCPHWLQCGRHALCTNNDQILIYVLSPDPPIKSQIKDYKKKEKKHLVITVCHIEPSVRLLYLSK